MPSLPPFKGMQCRPFEVIGLDYFGPVSVRSEENASNTIKGWVCLFTSLVTQNIHLEVVHDVTTTSFLNCFRRLIAFRGQPNVIYSDNATQFRAAQKKLSELWNRLIADEEICAYYANKGIT